MKRADDGGTHKMLHRSATHIMWAMPDMFSYTRYPNVPKTSNSIESFFGHLKDNLRLHRGLSNEHFKDFVKWYLFLQSNQEYQAKNREKTILFPPYFHLSPAVNFGIITLKNKMLRIKWPVFTGHFIIKRFLHRW